MYLKGGEKIMSITLIAKVQIYPSQLQKSMLDTTRKQIRKALNYISKYAFKNKCYNQAEINKALYYKIRNLFGLKSQMVQSCIKIVIARYKAIKSNGHELVLVNFKQGDYDLVFNRDYSLTENYVSINTLERRIKLFYETESLQKYFVNNAKLGTAKLVVKNNKYFLHIPITQDCPNCEMQDIHQIVGIDLGVNFIATTYDSQGKTYFYSGRLIKDKRAKFKYTRKRLQQRQTPASRHRLRAIGQRENSYVTNVNHQVTKALVNQYGANTLFVLEDLTGIRTVTEKVHINQRYYSVSWAFYQFREMLIYKAQMIGSKVICVNPAYTSQTCPKCGHTEKKNRNKKRHRFICKNCGYYSNDDRVGAMNLWHEGFNAIMNL